MAERTQRDLPPVCLGFLMVFLLAQTVAGVSVRSCAFQLRCTCITYSDGRVKVSCNRQELTTVPAPTDRNVTASFYLERNLISNIVPGSFSGMRKLEWLSLNGNKLRSIAAGVFSDLPKLQHLDLSRNKITSIAKDAFRKLPRLEWLKMSQNRLSSIDGGIFSDLSKLGEFFLDGNKLTSIGQDTFIGLTTLRYLMIHDNEIGTVEEGAFNDLTSLLGLHLAGNRLTFLDGEELVQLNKLAYFSLDNNPWHCDCRLQKLVDYLRQNRENIKTPSGQAAPLPNCTTPAALLGQNLLSQTEDTLQEQCLPSSQPPKPSPPPTDIMKQFRWTPGVAASMLNHEEVTPLFNIATVRDCAVLCWSRGKSECLSFEFMPVIQKCVLRKGNTYTVGFRLRIEPGVAFYELREELKPQFKIYGRAFGRRRPGRNGKSKNKKDKNKERERKKGGRRRNKKKDRTGKKKERNDRKRGKRNRKERRRQRKSKEKGNDSNLVWMRKEGPGSPPSDQSENVTMATDVGADDGAILAVPTKKEDAKQKRRLRKGKKKGNRKGKAKKKVKQRKTFKEMNRRNEITRNDSDYPVV
ncbi:RTN4R [Branchiostoma lanceolatum]|uniref:RTN4R protein n=1 Tax=Branchiostoma lanceolatum TaxID=7740 RepID=A0A8K0EBZ9_BRALA|nr:RTN4R [Branchiostoma lanceolatum]